MDLGTFPVSLAVEDMAASREFHQQLGFAMVADPDGNVIRIDQHV
jgi:predicted lactoylglutathione lyase